MPSANLRIATYNIGNGVRSGLDTVLHAIGDQVVNGDARPVDVLALQETDQGLSDVQQVTGLLNGIYGAGAYTWSTTVGQGDTTQGLVYRTSTVQLISAMAFGTVSTSGMPRQPIRYQLRPIGFGTSNDIYLYNSHTKASTGTTNEARRNVEAQAIRANADALGDGVNVIYVGDLNLYGNTEPAYLTLTSSGNGQAVDPTGTTNWVGASGAARHTQSPATTAAYPGQVTGGMDDRFDFQLDSGELSDGAGVDLIGSSYRELGNNGSTYNLAINSGSNTWAWNAIAGSTISRSSLLNALASVTDHIPVIADYDILGTPEIGSFTINPSSVTVGGTVSLTADNVTEVGGTIAGVNFYLESNGTSGLQIGSDTLVGAGTQSGTTWTLANVSTSGLAAGTYTYYAVATDAQNISSTPVSATLTVTNPVTSGELLGWEVNGQSNFGTQGLGASFVVSGLTNSLGLTRGSGVTTTNTAAANAWGGNGWASTSSAGISGNKFVTFGLTVGAGETASLSALDLHYRRSSTGPNSGLWQYEINGGAWTTIGDFSNLFSSTSTAGADMTALNLSTVAGLQNLSAGTVVDFRLVPYGATSSAGTWYVYNQLGDDLIVSGSVQATGGGGPLGLRNVPPSSGSPPAWGTAAGGFNLGGPVGHAPTKPLRTAARPAGRSPLANGTAGLANGTQLLQKSFGRSQWSDLMSVLDLDPVKEIRP
ncbi:MAG TPA: endonuclease/exonuclease/phosphatase family protein [Gemmataceae bacterium]|nr:endonuclease/exonuclease/phosphatase family protein [Gemmataceae bacterium]